MNGSNQGERTDCKVVQVDRDTVNGHIKKSLRGIRIVFQLEDVSSCAGVASESLETYS